MDIYNTIYISKVTYTAIYCKYRKNIQIDLKKCRFSLANIQINFVLYNLLYVYVLLLQHIIYINNSLLIYLYYPHPYKKFILPTRNIFNLYISIVKFLICEHDTYVYVRCTF